MNPWLHTQTPHIRTELCARKFRVYIWGETPPPDVIHFPLHIRLEFGLIIFADRGTRSAIAILHQQRLKVLGTILQRYPWAQLYILSAESAQYSSVDLLSWKGPTKEGATVRARGISSAQWWDSGLEGLSYSIVSSSPPSSVTQSLGNTSGTQKSLSGLWHLQPLHPTTFSCLGKRCICYPSLAPSCPLIPFPPMSHKSLGINHFSQVSSTIS